MRNRIAASWLGKPFTAVPRNYYSDPAMALPIGVLFTILFVIASPFLAMFGLAFLFLLLLVPAYWAFFTWLYYSPYSQANSRIRGQIDRIYAMPDEIRQTLPAGTVEMLYKDNDAVYRKVTEMLTSVELNYVERNRPKYDNFLLEVERVRAGAQSDMNTRKEFQ